MGGRGVGGGDNESTEQVSVNEFLTTCYLGFEAAI